VTVAESAATAIERGKAELVVSTTDGRSFSAGTVLVATGSEPNSRLAANLGIPLGTEGAIRVNRAMETGIPHIYAAGDCAETWHRLLGRSVYLPLGTTAHKQGLVAGANGAGGSASFAGSVGTQVVKIFGIVVARTGLLEREAVLGGFAPRTVEVESFDHKAYYPGAGRIWVRMTADERTGAILGGQILGRYSAEVSKRVDVLAAAVSEGMTVRELADLDLSYTPPTSSPWDPIQSCAHKWLER